MSVVGLAVPEPPSQVYAGISTSGLYSTSGSTLILRPPHARDLVTMAEDGPAPGRVTAGVGAVSRGAGTESDLPDRSVRPTLYLDLSPFLLPAITDELLASLEKFAQTAEARK